MAMKEVQSIPTVQKNRYEGNCKERKDLGFFARRVFLRDFLNSASIFIFGRYDQNKEITFSTLPFSLSFIRETMDSRMSSCLADIVNNKNKKIE